MDIRDYIRSFPDFPRPGIIFRDITPILKNPDAYRFVVERLEEVFRPLSFDLVVAIESRGFIFGISVANKLAKGFVPARKEGKLPGKTLRISYEIEYGSAALEIQSDAIQRGQRVIIIDDLLATGGTAKAAAGLVEMLGGQVVAIGFVIELASLRGRDKLKGYSVCSLVTYN